MLHREGVCTCSHVSWVYSLPVSPLRDRVARSPSFRTHHSQRSLYDSSLFLLSFRDLITQFLAERFQVVTAQPTYGSKSDEGQAEATSATAQDQRGKSPLRHRQRLSDGALHTAIIYLCPRALSKRPQGRVRGRQKKRARKKQRCCCVRLVILPLRAVVPMPN